MEFDKTEDGYDLYTILNIIKDNPNKFVKYHEELQTFFLLNQNIPTSTKHLQHFSDLTVQCMEPMIWSIYNCLNSPSIIPILH
mmetsp:Transcript_9033/g.1317  ORF Transcript_9033/g.1317 Transcript_9033/m.1317 type:complete len:83 (-) Transcript_9033:710-958(-)